MLGTYQKVRKTPLSRSTTKLHSAISPSMNDQWSGKTLRMFFLTSGASPSRESSQPTGPATARSQLLNSAGPALVSVDVLLLAAVLALMTAPLWGSLVPRSPGSRSWRSGNPRRPPLGVAGAADA